MRPHRASPGTKIAALKLSKNFLQATYQDRLLRFGNELLFELCRMMNVDVVVLNQEENPSFEEKLARDVLTILIV